MFCTNCHKIDITTGYCSWVEISVVSTYIYVLVQYCCLYWFEYQVPVYFLFGDMYIRARFTVVVQYAYIYICVCNYYSGMCM